MPIRFRCPHCQQRLSIGSHKTGVSIECPTCKAQVTVPSEVETLSVKETALASSAKEEKAVAIAPSVASSPSDAATTSPPSSANFLGITPLDDGRVSVPRSVIFSQGLLLGAVAVTCLVIGVFLGRAFSPTTSPIDPTTLPCVVTGRVEYEDSQGVRHADLGALILALPQHEQPEKSISSEGLGIDDAPPKADHPGLRELESVGARIARVGPNGRYELRVPRGGKFYLVAISKQSRRQGESHQPQITSAIGKFLAPPTRIVGQQRYQMTEPTLREERTVDFLFTRPKSSP